MQLVFILLVFICIPFVTYKVIAYAHRNLKRRLISDSKSRLQRSGIVALGLVVGLLFAMLPYQPSETLRIIGFPTPMAIFQRENGVWIDYIVSLPFIIAPINVLVGVGLVHLPVACIYWVKNRRRKQASGRAA